MRRILKCWRGLTTLLMITAAVGCDAGEPAVGEVGVGTAEAALEAPSLPSLLSCAPNLVANAGEGASAAAGCFDGDGMMGGLRFFDVVNNNFVLDPSRRALGALVATDLQAAAQDPFVQQAVAGARARRVLQYMVECALPSGSQVQFWTANQSWVGRFDGLGGMAPEWLTGACDARCQQTVSACLYARVNGDDRVVNLNVRRHIEGGGHVVDAYWKAHYPRLEAAYWGNYFLALASGSALDMHACFGFEAKAGDPSTQARVALFRKRYCGAYENQAVCRNVIAGPCGSTRSCPLAPGDLFGKQCKGDPGDPNQAVGACSPLPWDNACSSSATTAADYPTVTVFRADSCAHPDFQVGAPLDRECSACVAQVANGPLGNHCTTEWWGADCVQEAKECARALLDAGQPAVSVDPTASSRAFPLRLGTSDLVDAVCKDSYLRSCCQIGYSWAPECAERAKQCVRPANAGSPTCAPPPVL